MAKAAKFGLSPNAVIFMTMFIDASGFGMIIPLLPFYAVTFQAGSTALGLLVASFSIMQFFSSPVLGRISDRIGRKPVIVVSILTSLISFIVFALADSFSMLLISRIVAGLATETAVAQAYIADITSGRDRASGMGRVGAAHGAGFIIGPAIGGFLSVYGFAAPGFTAAFLTLLNLLLVLVFLPESRDHTGPTTRISSAPRRNILSRLLDALTRPLIGVVLVIHFIVFLAFSAIPVIVPLLAISYFSIGAVEMSYIFMYIGLVQIILQGVVIGRITARVGEEKLIGFGPLLMMLGVFLMPLLPSFGVFLASLTMVAFGSGIMRTVVPSFISKIAAVGEQGGVLGLASSMLSLATVPGPLIGGSLFEFAGLGAPFFASAALLACAFALSCRVFQLCWRRPEKPLLDVQ
jgi:DHA1 family tetracycline resistance protein-like MFS transporter